ncbi:MAG TPA: adenylyltransferase/cytidyltransferase family protein [Candidatus Saccharimonadales bacterium]|nr:adenylyltransferase/cytidyltransferase family protein [Candidatus Saccharimonadales bacterium]
MTKKIGIFAGTFDPIHDGHIAFAQAALDAGLEKVMFLPEPRPRRKQGVRALEHRRAMVRLAIAHEGRYGIIALEQARFTVHETLPKLQARFAGYQLVLLFGADVISHIASWPHVGAMVNVAELMIAARLRDMSDLTATLHTLEKTRNLRFRYEIIHPAYEEVTSSTIRLLLKRDKAADGLPPAVQRYIKRHKLYSTTTAD